MIGEVTQLLQHMKEGDASAHARLMELLYPELHRIAEGRMRSERPDHTLQPTALVNEFFLQLARRGPISYGGRSHFLAVASEVMRRLLIDYARAHRSAKRGGNVLRVQLDELALPQERGGMDLLEMTELLEKLAQEDPRMARVVEMHLFAGMTFREIADQLGVDERTAKRDWQVARAWLYGQMKKVDPDVSRGMGPN
jgi:RNA polymerase sigma factor (TIGR02999 family)